MVSSKSNALKEINPANYIILDDKSKFESGLYPDLWVAKHRLASSKEVKRAARSLKLNIENTAQEKNRKYLYWKYSMGASFNIKSSFNSWQFYFKPETIF